MPSANASRPARMKSTAATNCVRPETGIPAYFLKSHAVSGQAEMPEKSANHPFVSGHGPLIKSRPNPPPPAMIVHAQPTTKHAITTIRLIGYAAKYVVPFRCSFILPFYVASSHCVAFATSILIYVERTYLCDVDQLCFWVAMSVASVDVLG